MSKKEKRTPFPEDPVAGFAMTVAILSSQLGMDRYPNVYHYVELLQQSCDRYIFEVEHNVTPERKIEKEKRTFITVFKARYLQFMDLEYEITITGVDARMMRQTCKKLQEKGLGVNDFLGWVFEQFLEENPKFCPPSIKQVCGAFVWNKFLYENRAKMKELHRNELVRKESLALVARARVLMRTAVDSGEEQFKEKVKKALLDFKNGGIILGKLRGEIEALEREQASWPKEAQ